MNSLSYRIWGRFKNTFPHINLEFQPLGCETIFFGIRTFFNLHPDYIVMQINLENAFNGVFQTTIFKELRDVGGPLVNIVPFTRLFYGVCRNPTLGKVGECNSHSQKWRLGLLRDSRKFRRRFEGSNLLAFSRVLYQWKALEV